MAQPKMQHMRTDGQLKCDALTFVLYFEVASNSEPVSYCRKHLNVVVGLCCDQEIFGTATRFERESMVNL